MISLVSQAQHDRDFRDFRRTFEAAKVRNWLEEEEMALFFGVGAFAPGAGSIVEIGSFHGGSACFLAAGLRKRLEGRLTCVDPHLGGPLWLGTAPHQHTLEAFGRN